MGFKPSTLWTAPEVNPINKKARSVPLLNPINVYGRVFFFSWFGFMIAFWSWYAFPPLLNDVIKKDLHLTKNQILNSNIIGLVATLLVRLAAGPACDRFGPRYTFAACLLVGAIPTFLAGTAYNVHELYALRFFIGILGGSFVPCQVWTTGFYDKNIVGTANSLTAGLGNAGGGITYFVMPAVYKSLVGEGLTPHVAWRVAFIVPGILIVFSAVTLVLLCPDTPTGKWSERTQAAENNLRQHEAHGTVVDVPGSVTEKKSEFGNESPSALSDEEKKLGNTRGVFGDHEHQMGEQQMLDTARGEVIQKPSFTEVIKVMASPQTLVCGAVYFCTFGTELSVNGILGNWYTLNLKLGLQESGNWAAMFGLMNVVCRPLGGLVGDLAYNRTGSVWSKKLLMHAYGLITGAFLVATGVTNSKHLHELVLLIGVGVAFFLEGCNGLVFSLVPHVHPYANGVVSGFTGAMGNLGGIIFAIIFRYVGAYGKSTWIIGVIVMAIHLCVCWVPPIPKGQIGGR
ncbi:nitrate transporter-like [Teratosphaeria destructans]|uniref:Nitrate/nitrite transporter n=1 Tax=Teratosphaeria destructans TaxID=418781 RepID=A0A9W7VYZ1_9PEZI|nr:nitrate transporter-like [Teratosphaeria destructans]